MFSRWENTLCMNMDFEKLKEFRNNAPGLISELGIYITDLEEGYARLVMPVTEKVGNVIGTIHGGAIFALADTAGGAAAYTRGHYVTTVDGDISYLNPPLGAKELVATARELKYGKTILVYEIQITDEKEHPIAQAKITYFRLQKKLELV